MIAMFVTFGILGVIAVAIVVAVYFTGGLPSRHPDRVLKKLEGVTDERRLMKRYRRCSSPQVRRAILGRLSPERIGQLMGCRGVNSYPLLSYIDDYRTLRAVLPHCPPAMIDRVEKAVNDRYLKQIDEGKDQQWLASIVTGREKKEVRIRAERRLTDQALIAEAAAACSNEPDDEIFRLLLSHLNAPESLLRPPLADRLSARGAEMVRQHMLCKGQHQFDISKRAEHNSVELIDKPHERLVSAVVSRCRRCGARAKYVRSPKLNTLSFMDSMRVNREQLDREICRAYRQLDSADPQQLAGIIGDVHRDGNLRVAAAERLWDEALILPLLRELDSDGVKGVLIWQLSCEFDFASIAADPGYGMEVRRTAVSRVWDADALERLSRLEGLKNECIEQRFEAICPVGHDWKLEKTEIVYQDEEDWGSIRWNVPTYRCARCGKTKQGAWKQC